MSLRVKRRHWRDMRFTGIILITALILPLLAGCQARESTGTDSSQGDSGTPAAIQPVQVKQLTPSPDYGAQAFLWGNAPTTDRDLKLMKDAGFTWVKQMFQWNYIEGKGKGKFEWNEPDRIIKATESYNLKLIARVDFSPTWARPAKADPNVDGPPVKNQDFADFMGALAGRYKGRIAAYQIWNEPNLARDWGGNRPNAAEYTELLKVAYKAIKAADPNAIVISAGLSPTTASGNIATPDIEYLSQMYAAGAKDYFDMLGVHAAGYRSPPEADPAQVAKDPKATNNDPSPESLKRTYAFRHVEDLRQLMLQNGDGGKQVAVLEFGWTSDDRPASPYKWHAVTEEQKAQYLAGAFQYAKDNWQPWIGVMSLIYISSPQWTASDEQYYWSITDPKGKTKLAYDRLKALKK